MGINFSNPVCHVDQCLNQVIGVVDGLNGPAHYSACVSYFGPLAIATETPLVSVFTSFATETVQYTSIVIETSTAYSTSDSTSTSYTQVVETASAYSATAVETATVTLPLNKKRHRGKKRSPCKPSIPPSFIPSSTAASTTTPSWWPLASKCPTLEGYESACACIYAVSTATRTITLVPLVSTAVATNTVSSLVESTATSVVNTVVINRIATVATSTFVSTTTGIYQTTTTVTEVAEPVQTRITFLQFSESSTLFARIDEDNFLSYDPSKAGSSSGAVQVKFVPSGEQPSLAGHPTFKLVLGSLGADYGLLKFEENSSSPVVTWGVVSEKVGEPITFASLNTGYDTTYTCNDGLVYLAGPNWIEEPETDEGGNPIGPLNPCFQIRFMFPSNQR
ncbi:hypothetical protein B0T25DRAFT_250449 [Lasiosphaeria hispida]|uniref:Uncharacterized protein n=1 Tax=Lasiosphaeria hispida TaxID=260671 RepID=A0AAJ0MCR5_9PEZI|nr:hypothetical protein B0T25DRAFT_250449 [Lasiosphaeria hispida]